MPLRWHPFVVSGTVIRATQVAEPVDGPRQRWLSLSKPLATRRPLAAQVAEPVEATGHTQGPRGTGG
ncbi:hypothetical protein CHE218_06270 [Microbacterium sp. che218]